MSDELEITRTFQYNVDPQFVYDLTSDLELAHDIRLGIIETNLVKSSIATSMTEQATTAGRTKQEHRKIYAFMALYYGIRQWSIVAERRNKTYRASYMACFIMQLRQTFEDPRDRFDEEEYWNNAIKGYGYACAASILVHRRIQGETLPYEGIRIVRKLATNDAS